MFGPRIQTPADRQLTTTPGVRIQSGVPGGGVVSQYAIGFDGVDDYIPLGTPSALNLSAAYTLSAWIKPSAGGVFGDIIASISNPANQAQFALEYNRTAGKITCLANGSTIAITSSASLIDNLWQLVTVTKDGTVGNWTYIIYINGQFDATATVSANADSQQVVAIGRAGDFNGVYFGGLIDDLRIYNRALTAAEISSIYANTSSPPTDGLVAYFPMDEGTGTTTTDTIGGLVGTLTNGPTWETDVPSAL